MTIGVQEGKAPRSGADVLVGPWAGPIPSLGLNFHIC